MATTAADVLTYARQIGQTDSNGITDTLGLALANDILEDMTREFMERNIDAGMIGSVSIPITAGTGVYGFPDGALYASVAGMYQLKTIEINLTDTTQGNYLQGERVDVSNLQGQTSFDFLRLNQPANNPLFDNQGNTFEIFPTPTLTLNPGVKLQYWKVPTEFAATSSNVVYPFTLDYRAISTGVVWLYNTLLKDLQASEYWKSEYAKRFTKIINILAPGSQQPITPDKLHITGFEF